MTNDTDQRTKEAPTFLSRLRTVPGKVVALAFSIVIIGPLTDLWLRHDQSVLGWVWSRIRDAVSLHLAFDLLLVLAILVLSFLVWQLLVHLVASEGERQEQNKIAQTLVDMYDLHSSFLRNMHTLALYHGNDEGTRRVVTEVLRDASKVFGDQVLRSYILTCQGDHLVPFVEEQMPSPQGYSRHFYIGSNKERRHGVAGTAFLEGSSRVVHVVLNEEGQWTHDDPEFLDLDPSGRPPAYRSFVCVPMVTQTRKVGVLCMDSPGVSTFDDEHVQEFLVDVGTVIARALTLAWAIGEAMPGDDPTASPIRQVGVGHEGSSE